MNEAILSFPNFVKYGNTDDGDLANKLLEENADLEKKINNLKEKNKRKIEQSINWCNQRLKLRNQELTKEQIEMLKFSLLLTFTENDSNEKQS